MSATDVTLSVIPYELLHNIIDSILQSYEKEVCVLSEDVNNVSELRTELYRQWQSLRLINKTFLRLVDNCSTVWTTLFALAFGKLRKIERLVSSEFKTISEQFIGSEIPAQLLLKRLKQGKYLLVHNRAELRDLSKQLKTNWHFSCVDYLKVPNPEANTYETLLATFSKYNAILVETIFGWIPSKLGEYVGDALYDVLTGPKGVGIITSVFVGCSWVESPRGKWEHNQCQAIIPNVEVNNSPGSQDWRKWSFITFNTHHFTEPQSDNHHFILEGVSSEHILAEVDYVSLGKPNPKGKLWASITGESVALPFIVDMENTFAGKSVSINARTNHCPTRIIANALLYCSNIH